MLLASFLSLKESGSSDAYCRRTLDPYESEVKNVSVGLFLRRLADRN